MPFGVFCERLFEGVDVETAVFEELIVAGNGFRAGHEVEGVVAPVHVRIDERIAWIDEHVRQ